MVQRDVLCIIGDVLYTAVRPHDCVFDCMTARLQDCMTKYKVLANCVVIKSSYIYPQKIFR
jgi:hypothetical protein